MISLTNDILVYLGNFIEYPSEIIKCREVSKLFKERVTEVAFRAFFRRIQPVIQAMGFRYFSGDSVSINFRRLFSLIAKVRNRSLTNIDQLFFDFVGDIKRPHCLFPSVVLRTHWDNFNDRDLRNTNTFWDWVKSDDRVKSISKISHSKFSKLLLIPHEIIELKCLQTLKISNSQLTWVPIFVVQLKELDVLDLSHNRIESIFSDFSQMPKLRYLNVSGNQLDALPSAELFKREDCLCMNVDAQTLVNSKDVLENYTSVFFVFSPPPVDASFTAEFFNSVMFHNSRVFQKFSEGIIDTDEEIDIDAYNDMLDWTQLGTHKKEFPIESLERRMQSGMKYLSELMPSRRIQLM